MALRVLDERRRRRTSIVYPYVINIPQQPQPEPQMYYLNLQTSQSAVQQRSPGTISITEPLTNDAKDQKQLHLLFHAFRCLRIENNSNCALPSCSAMKHVINHMQTCVITAQCPVPHCSSSRQLLLHWRNCSKDICNICALSKKSPYRSCQTGTSALSRDLQGLFLSGNDSDVTIEVQGQIFKAHRLILKSRSPVFAAMFEHNMQESNSGIVKVDDCDPDTFHNFLQCLYTGRVDNLLFDNASNLYRVADKYALMDLKEICVNLMVKELSVDTACDMIILADLYNDIRLKNYTLDFLAANMKTVLSTSKWSTFVTENSALAAMILERAFMNVTS